MRGFEQGASTARCTIIQFHRPAELKLIRICERYAFPVCSPDIQGFLSWEKRSMKENAEDERKVGTLMYHSSSSGSAKRCRAERGSLLRRHGCAGP